MRTKTTTNQIKQARQNKQAAQLRSKGKVSNSAALLQWAAVGIFTVLITIATVIQF